MDDLLLALSLTYTRFHEVVTALMGELMPQHLRDDTAWYQSGLVSSKSRVPLDWNDASSSVSSSSSLEPKDLMGPKATFEHFGDEMTSSIQDLGFGPRAYMVAPALEAFAEEAAQCMCFASIGICLICLS